MYETIFTKNKIANSKELLPIKGKNTSTPYPCTLQVNGDLDSDVITITLVDPDDNMETDDYDSDGVINVLSKTNPKMTFFGPVNIKISKPTTTNNVNLTLISV